ncbi:MAG: hypothetical protein ACYC6Y_25685 [Thermoguttaceae bacterium]
MWLARIMCALVFMTLIGCANNADKSTPVQQAAPTDQIKSALQNVADTGTVDSGLMTVREQLETLKATDAAKAETLLADLAELEKLSDDAAKKKAQDMIGKL